MEKKTEYVDRRGQISWEEIDKEEDASRSRPPKGFKIPKAVQDPILKYTIPYLQDWKHKLKN